MVLQVVEPRTPQLSSELCVENESNRRLQSYVVWVGLFVFLIPWSRQSERKSRRYIWVYNGKGAAEKSRNTLYRHWA